MSYTEEELASQLAQYLGGRVNEPDVFAGAVLKSFARIQDSEIQGELNENREIIRTPDPRTGGISFKPGNIRLNWRKLVEKVPELVLTGAGVATAQAWLIFFAALHLWNVIWSLSKIEITPAQAMTLYALWKDGRPSRRFPEAEALEIVNAYRVKTEHAAFTVSQFAYVVNKLVALDCIELEDGEIWLREWVKKSNE